MIIDTHAYCFEAFDSPRGFPGGAEEHMALAASSYAGHHQPVVRLNDNALGEASPTLRDFRLDKRRGRVVWTGEGGREFTKYFTPPNLLGLEFTPYSLDSEMHHA